MRSLNTVRPRLIEARNPAVMFALALLIFSMSAACRSSNKNEAPAGLVVIKAPATGEVRRVLVSEGAAVNEGAAIIEVAVKTDAPAVEENKPEDRARVALGAAQREIADAEAEVNRASVEVQRVEPLVSSGAAPQAQLDAARAQYQQAQERLDRVRDRARSAQTSVTSQQESKPPTVHEEKIIAVRVPAQGTVRVISARVGQQVTAGQAIATLSSQSR
jgi:multidrug resistance efflux pump